MYVNLKSVPTHIDRETVYAPFLFIGNLPTKGGGAEGGSVTRFHRDGIFQIFAHPY